MRKRVFILACAIGIALLSLPSARAEYASVLSTPAQCWHVVCWTYEGYNVPGIGSVPERTVCELEVETCDGRAGELRAQ